MKRILVFCARDWRDPKAGLVEYYVHEVLTRLAAQGHYVLWACHSYRAGLEKALESGVSPMGASARRWLSRSRRRPAPLETVEGIQVARLGARIFYRSMANMFLTRLRAREKSFLPFDVILDCVTRRPLELDHEANAPILPVVFDLAKHVCAVEEPPGPSIAVSEVARAALCRSGLRENFIVRAPYGVQSSNAVLEPSDDPLLAVSGSCIPWTVKKAVRRLERKGIHLDVCVHRPEVPASHDESRVWRRAWFGFCPPGGEAFAAEMGAAGLTVVCTPAMTAREYVDDASGLSVPNNACALAEAFERLIRDEGLHARLAMAACERARRQTWEMTASLVLATIENLRPEENKRHESEANCRKSAIPNALK